LDAAVQEGFSRRLARLAPWIGATMLAVGIGAVLITFYGNTADTSAPPAAPAERPRAAEESPGKRVKLSRETTTVAARFIKTAVARQNLAEGWRLAHPELRLGNTRREWLRGTSTVQPYPVDTAKPPPFKIDESFERRAMLRVVLSPRPGAGDFKPQIFFIGLKAVGRGEQKRWLVNYWAPYAAQSVPLAE
jgi:hypothetical protein